MNGAVDGNSRMLIAYLELLERGASPAVARVQSGVARDDVRRAVESDAAFRQRVAEAQAMLSENVLAALYRAAIEGNVTAQSFWLKMHPPPGWGEDREQTAGPMTFDELLSELTDEELRQLEVSMGCHGPDQGP